MPGQLTQEQLVQLNLDQRALVLNNSVEMINPLPSQMLQGVISAGNNQFQFNLRNVGLLKRLIVEISGTYNNTDGALAATATPFGLAALLQNILFTDLNNSQRINTTGIHLAILKQMRHRTSDPASAGVSQSQSDAGMVAGEFVAAGAASNFPVIVYPLPAFGVSAAFRAVFEIPIAYSDDDLRGGIYLNIINAVAQLNLTLNPNPSPKGTDNTLAVWGAASGTISNVTATCYQVYLDQLPSGDGGVILPTLDLSTVYEMKWSNFSAIVAGQDFPIPYANFRDFLSTLVLFNSTALTAGMKNGSDVNYWAIQAANFTNLLKLDPLLAAQRVREIMGSDLPLGTYFFSHRKKPISTLQYGNMQLILNAISAAAGAYMLVGWEDFAMVNTLTQAGSLAG